MTPVVLVVNCYLFSRGEKVVGMRMAPWKHKMFYVKGLVGGQVLVTQFTENRDYNCNC